MLGNITHRIQNRIPLMLELLGFIYIFGTVLYYIYFCVVYNRVTSNMDVYNVLSVLNYHRNTFVLIQNLFIMITTPIVGLGLIRRRKWGLFMFLAYGFCLIGLNIANIIIYPKQLSIWWWVPNIITILVLLVFTRIELRAPFFKPDWHIREQRYKHNIPVEYKSSNKDEAKRAVTEDISENGCYIAVDEEHSLGEIVSLVFEPDGERLELEGEIVWIGGGKKFSKGFGVLFNHMNEEKLNAIFEIAKK